MPPVSVVGGFGAIEVGNEVVLLQRCTQRKYKESTVQRLSPVPARSVRGSLRADVTDVVLVESGQTAPTQLDASQVEADDVSMDAHGAKREGSPPTAAAMKRANAGPSPASKSKSFGNGNFVELYTGGVVTVGTTPWLLLLL